MNLIIWFLIEMKLFLKIQFDPIMLEFVFMISFRPWFSTYFSVWMEFINFNTLQSSIWKTNRHIWVNVISEVYLNFRINYLHSDNRYQYDKINILNRNTNTDHVYLKRSKFG